MTNTTQIYFRELGPAYVNVGGYTVKKKYKKGITPIQGAYQAGVNPVIRDLDEYDVYSGVYTGADSHNLPLKTNAEIEANPEAFIDNAAFASGTYVSSKEYLTVPRFRVVRLFYMYKQDGSHDLMQFDPVVYNAVKKAGDPTANAYVASLVDKILTEEEYLALCGARGFTQYGNPLPKGFGPSSVSELSSLSIEFVDANPDTGDTVLPALPVYVTPLYIQNSLPMFDAAYMEMDTLSILEDEQDERRKRWAGIPDRILRWQGGGMGSDYIAPINRDGPSISRDSLANKNVSITIDGVTYFNADEFGLNSMPHS
jgi:hypothetical protein